MGSSHTLRVARHAPCSALLMPWCWHCLRAVKVPVFRGDNVHSFEITGPDSRRPDPSRLVDGYRHSRGACRALCLQCGVEFGASLFSLSHFWCMQRHFVCCEAWCPRRSRICLVLPMPFRVCSQRLAPVPLLQATSDLCPCQLVPVTRPWRVPGATLSLLSVAAWLMRGQLWYRGPRREPACSRHMRASA